MGELVLERAESHVAIRGPVVMDTRQLGAYCTANAPSTPNCGEKQAVLRDILGWSRDARSCESSTGWRSLMDVATLQHCGSRGLGSPPPVPETELPCSVVSAR